MKRNISDILDAYEDSSVVLEQDTPLSSQRIKELTMSKMKVRRNVRHLGVRLIAVAAIISLLAVTAFGAESAVGWFQAFFSESAGAELSQGQIDFIDSNVREEDQGEIIGKYHVMLDSFISDGGMAHVRIGIQGIDGTNTTDEYYTFRQMDVITMDGENVSTGIVWGWEEVCEDTNTTVYLLSFDCVGLTQTDGDATVRLELTDLCKESGEQLTEGTWKFEIQLPDVSSELLAEPLTGVVVYEEDGEELPITVTSVCLRAMGLHIKYERLDPDTMHHPGAVKVVLKDGSETELIPSGWGRESDDPNALCWIEYGGALLAVEDVAYIVLPGEVWIAVNLN